MLLFASLLVYVCVCVCIDRLCVCEADIMWISFILSRCSLLFSIIYQVQKVINKRADTIYHNNQRKMSMFETMTETKS